jgi:chromosome partitioning protein
MSPPVIVCGNVKGGVGKTTTAVQLALHAGGAGNRTLLVDADPGRSALSWATRAEDWPHAMVPVIAHHHPDLPRRLPGLATGYDLVVVDCPHDPTGGARVGPTLASAIAVADLLVIPSPPSLADLDRLEDLMVAVAAEEARRDLRWVLALTRVDLRRRGGAEAIAEALGTVTYGTGGSVLPLELAIPERAAVEDAFGSPVVLVEYEPLATAVLAMLAETTGVRA